MERYFTKGVTLGGVGASGGAILAACDTNTYANNFSDRAEAAVCGALSGAVIGFCYVPVMFIGTAVAISYVYSALPFEIRRSKN